jgi:gamma-glutamylputrescine oxidase
LDGIKLPAGKYDAVSTGPASAFNYAAVADPAHLPPQTPLPQTFDDADVVIIGGGYIGLSTAYHLAEDAKAQGRTLNIVVLEGGKIGSGPSGHSMGHVVGELEAPAEQIRAHCGPDLAARLIAHGENGPALVKGLIDRLDIPAGLQEGYAVIDRDARPTVYDDGSMFGIRPLPYTLGLAQRARELGVKIYEDTLVTNVTDDKGRCTVATNRGDIRSSYVVAAGGHRMGQTVPELSDLDKNNFTLYASTIITDRLPPEVIRAVLPHDGNGQAYPFANTKIDVGYGSVVDGRIVFGAGIKATDRAPDKDRIARELFAMFPTLRNEYKKATGKELAYETLVAPKALDFTMDLLPEVGRRGDGGRIYYAHGLSGRGIALGTMLGKGIADDIYSAMNGTPNANPVFSDFSQVKHAGTALLKSPAIRAFAVAALTLPDRVNDAKQFVAKGYQAARQALGV